METNKVYLGDCVTTIKTFPDNSIDSIVTDPPYELGFMGKSWDNTGIANSIELWSECLRVLKPGGHLLSFGGTRTYHRMACAIEDAGFEVRDMIEWVYGSGFPKSLNIGKAVDKMRNKNFDGVRAFLKLQIDKSGLTHNQLLDKLGLKQGSGLVTHWTTDNEDSYQILPSVKQWNNLREVLGFSNEFDNDITEHEREIIGTKKSLALPISQELKGWGEKTEYNITIPATEQAKQWEGRGTALKPAHEPICMARKPLGYNEFINTRTQAEEDEFDELIALEQDDQVLTDEQEQRYQELKKKEYKQKKQLTVAENCIKWGTGGINIDVSRVGTTGARNNGNSKGTEGSNSIGVYGKAIKQDYNMGRFPANLILSDCEEVRECFPDSKGGAFPKTHGSSGFVSPEEKEKRVEMNDSGNASRFFKSILYYPKSSKAERNIGLDGQVLISIMGSYLFPITTECTEKPDQNQLHLLDIEASQQKGGLECEIKIKKGKDLNISLFEKLTTDQYLNECKSIISTTTGGTMILAILNWLRHCITKEYTVDANGEIEFGENLVENVEGGKKLTTTIKGKIEFLHDAKNVVLEMQLIIKEKENRNFHSTIKPIALMEYLIKMVTKPGGVVLDPFAGSGTTLVAAKKNGYQYIGCELTEEYIPIIEARLQAEKQYPDNSLFS